MPYDDPILRELGGYFKAEEPGRRECVGVPLSTAVSSKPPYRDAKPDPATEGPDKGGHWGVMG